MRPEHLLKPLLSAQLRGKAMFYDAGSFNQINKQVMAYSRTVLRLLGERILSVHTSVHLEEVATCHPSLFPVTLIILDILKL